VGDRERRGWTARRRAVAVAALVGLAASYVVVEAARGEDLRGAEDAPPELRRWALPVLQVAAPFAACGPVAFALLLAL
jgi:negative regulator of sigma E activity